MKEKKQTDFCEILIENCNKAWTCNKYQKSGRNKDQFWLQYVLSWCSSKWW